MPDGWEVDNSLSPTSDDALTDQDSDGLSNLAEYLNDTNPQLQDTDSDSMYDGWEVDNDLDPNTDDSGDDPEGYERYKSGEGKLGKDVKDFYINRLITPEPEIQSLSIKIDYDKWRFRHFKASSGSTPPVKIGGAILDGIYDDRKYNGGSRKIKNKFDMSKMMVGGGVDSGIGKFYDNIVFHNMILLINSIPELAYTLCHPNFLRILKLQKIESFDTPGDKTEADTDKKNNYLCLKGILLLLRESQNVESHSRILDVKKLSDEEKAKEKEIEDKKKVIVGEIPSIAVGVGVGVGPGPGAGGPGANKILTIDTEKKKTTREP